MILNILFKVFFFEIAFVSSISIQDTFHEGDLLIVNKLAYGPLMPKHLQDIPPTLCSFPLGIDRGEKTTVGATLKNL